MSQLDKKIADEIREIAMGDKPGKRFPVMSGKVTGSVNETAGTCTVLLSTNDDTAPTKGVLLNAVSANLNGLLLIPAADSDVWVAEIDGKGKYGIVKCSNLEKAIVKIGTSKLTITSAGIKIEHGGLDFKTVMGSFMDHMKTVTLAVEAFTGSGPVNSPLIITDKANFDLIFA